MQKKWCICRLLSRFLPCNHQKWTYEKIEFRKEHPRIRIQAAPEKGIRQELYGLWGKEENVTVPGSVTPNHHGKDSPHCGTIATSSPKDPRGDNYGTNNRSQQLVGRVEREERAELCRETERGESEQNYSEMNTQRETVAPGETRSEKEEQKQYVNFGETLNSSDQRKEREREATGDCVMERPREEVRHEATRTEEDSAYLRVIGQMSERRNEKIVWRASGIVIESPIGSALEVGSKIAIVDILEGEGCTQMQSGHKAPEVNGSIARGPPREPLPGRLVNRLNEWKKIGGDKLVSRGIRARWMSPHSTIALEERKHRQDFRGKKEMKNIY
ncbi:uncharacterized protein MONOS_10806 [Monocercomonoides exilis]|uniref:uncharacterized protein n=1 Tax=Monocercomonoides exilis TaxID=2049356 RepID=UPI00355AACB1|nr:hypothetical protein MONOS_10806 [Monocercomonoides exilis]|eukprot:MONOS_10806.1-p1 / transcript=MONOS_10806.1 / gene=MONOS_10806 / organism=Monocercomonoides_exilis_PA203 / gene_product=unspecified product / transcript_product=unspecified product / location=Mono_scaffold00506:20830-21819(-) / protein_length=330 / sequence_SO=supercontig / SO=protein_coding / is_pseudo=false